MSQAESNSYVQSRLVAFGMRNLNKRSGIVKQSGYPAGKIHGWGLMVIDGLAFPQTYCGDGVGHKAVFKSDDEPITCEHCKMTANRLELAKQLVADGVAADVSLDDTNELLVTLMNMED